MHMGTRQNSSFSLSFYFTGRKSLSWTTESCWCTRFHQTQSKCFFFLIARKIRAVNIIILWKNSTGGGGCWNKIAFNMYFKYSNGCLTMSCLKMLYLIIADMLNFHFYLHILKAFVHLVSLRVEVKSLELH